MRPFASEPLMNHHALQPAPSRRRSSQCFRAPGASAPATTSEERYLVVFDAVAKTVSITLSTNGRVIRRRSASPECRVMLPVVPKPGR